MHPGLFDLDFSNWPLFLISAIPAFINLVLYAYIVFYSRQNTPNRTLSIFLLLLCITQLADGLEEMALSIDGTLAWNRIAFISLLFAMPIGLLFVLKLTGKTKTTKPNRLNFFLFFPPIILSVLVLGDADQAHILKSQVGRWTYEPTVNLPTIIIYCWIVAIALLTLSILLLTYINEKENTVRKKQSMVLALGIISPLLGGVICEVAFPLLLGINSLPLTTPLITAFSISIIISITRFSILEFSPKHQWADIVKSINQGLLMTDNNDRIMFANPAFCAFTGYQFNELWGKIAYELLLDAPEDRLKIIRVISERKQNISSSYEIQVRAKDGKKLWMNVSGIPYLDKNGEVIGSIGIHTDITELKKLTGALEYNNTLLKEAQAIAHVGSWELDLKTGVSTWSDEACRIYGLLPGYNKHVYATWLGYIHPDDLVKFKSEIENAYERLSDFSFKHRIITEDGTVKRIHSMSRFKFDEKGMAIGLVGTCIDITEQYNYEQKILESERRLRNFTKHLNEVIEDEKSSLAREIHDEFGQYTAGIKLGLSYIYKQVKDNEKLEARVKSLLNEVENSQQSIRKIATRLRPGILDTLGLTASIEWLGREFEKKSDIKFKIEIKNGHHKNYDEETQICFFRICQEAISNAMKHSQATEVQLSLVETTENIELKISDNGVGIDPAKVNNPFSMGLLGMHERARLIGADFEVCNNKNNGTIIKLNLKTPCHEKHIAS